MTGSPVADAFTLLVFVALPAAALVAVILMTLGKVTR